MTEDLFKNYINIDEVLCHIDKTNDITESCDFFASLVIADEDLSIEQTRELSSFIQEEVTQHQRSSDILFLVD